MKKNFRKSLRIGLGVTAALAGVTFIPVASQVNVYADTGEQMTNGSITPARLKELKAEAERAQAEYDAAVADEEASRAEVVNAERARDDALERYNVALENYHKGYAGFLQWIINTMDTSDDEGIGLLRVAEAQQVLADLALPEYESIIGEQMAGLFNFTGDATEDMGKASSSTNLTRMYHTLDWMEKVNEYSVSGESVNIMTSNAAMLTAMEMADFLQDVPGSDGKNGAVSTNNSYDWMSSFITGFYGGVDFKSVYINDIPGEVSDDGTPNILYDSIVTPSELFDFRIRGFLGYDADEDEYRYSETPNSLPETAVMGFALGRSEKGDYLQWAIADEYEGNFSPVYTLGEYISLFREYFSISDPTSTKLAYINAGDDLSNANKKLAGAQELVTARLGRLRETEKEYEEAVALFNQQQAQAPAIEEIPVIEENVSQENESTGIDIEYVPAEEVAVEENVVNERTESIEVQPANTETETTFTETEGLQAEVVTVRPEVVEEKTTNTESETTFTETEGSQAEVETSLSEVIEEKTTNTESVATFTESVSPQTEAVTSISESVEVQAANTESVEQYYDSGNLQQEQLEVAAAYNESVEIKDSAASYEIKQTEDNIYEVTEETPAQAAWMKALSYFFNGGAIAFIIPAGIKRRRKPDGTPFTVS